MSRAFRLLLLLGITAGALASESLAQAPADNDHTLQAMHDEMARAKSRLEIKFPGSDEPVRPYYIEYRLLDLDVREVVAEFGALMTTAHSRNRFMDVSARVGNYKQDSSNFISDDGFRGFIGSTGSVGIDRDYDSLRQDLWIATDQAFKEAVETYSRKRAYLTSLARQSDIDDFSKVTPVENRAVGRTRLEQPQLGTGSAGDLGGAAGLSRDSRFPRDLLSGLCDGIFVDQRGYRDSRHPLFCRDRSGHEHAGARRHGIEQLLCFLCARPGGPRERRHGQESFDREG